MEVRPMSTVPNSLGDGGFAERFLHGCPDWCVYDHDGEERDDLITHLGDEHTDGSVRDLLDAHRLDLRVARTDDRHERTIGTPNLYVRIEAELTTWEQAAELARTILDSFGYIEGA
jgi:hypothetical protein